MTKLDQNNPNDFSKDEVIDLRELFDLLWGGKKLIILITSVFVLCSIIYGKSLENHYKSETLMSIEEGSGGGFSQAGGLASLAGFSITAVSTKGPMVTNTINSRAFFKHLISVDESILPSLIAVESYDSESKKLVFNSDIYDAANKQWLVPPPSYIRAFSAYRSVLHISYIATTRLVSMTAEHVSPIFAKELLDIVIREADDLIRKKDQQSADEALGYLTAELSKTSLIEIKNAINKLIMSQIQTQMMTRISTNYVFNMIEPPYLPYRISSPSRSFIYLIGTVLGLVISILWLLIRRYFALKKIKQTSGS